MTPWLLVPVLADNPHHFRVLKLGARVCHATPRKKININNCVASYIHLFCTLKFICELTDTFFV